MKRWLVTLALALSLATSAPCGGSKATPAIDGTWIVVSAEYAGEKMADEIFKGMKLVLADGKYTTYAGNEIDRGAVRLDAAKQPKAMDIVGLDGPNKDKTFLAIYDLTADTLRICYDLSGKSRPTELKSKPGTQLFLATYRRQKP